MAELIKIQILRGTEAQVESASNDAGKPYFATDSKRVFVSDGTSKHLIGKAFFGTDVNKPTASTLLTGMVWIATDTGKTYYCNGTAWVASAYTNLSDVSGDLDDISDGTTYGKVKNSELTSGQVVQVRAETGAANISGDDIKTHLDDADAHREINDAGTGLTELWSASKINSELNALNADNARVAKVINYVDNTAVPPTEVTGDRYILDFTGGGVNAAWDTADVGDLVEFDGADWIVKVDASNAANEGIITYSDDENKDRLLVNDGSPSWELRSSAITAHNDLTGLNSGDYRHLTAAEYTVATQAATASLNGYMTSTYAAKLDGIDAGAQVNQDITAQTGVKRTDSNGANGDAVIEADFEDADANIGAVLKGAGTGSAGTSDKVARADHQHRMVDVDAGTL